MNFTDALAASQLLQAQLALRLLYCVLTVSLSGVIHFCLWYLLQSKLSASINFAAWWQKVSSDRLGWLIAIFAGSFFLLNLFNLLLVSVIGAKWYYSSQPALKYFSLPDIYALCQFSFNAISAALALSFLFTTTVMMYRLFVYFHLEKKRQAESWQATTMPTIAQKAGEKPPRNSAQPVFTLTTNNNQIKNPQSASTSNPTATTPPTANSLTPVSPSSQQSASGGT